MALDVGDRRIGIAITDAEGITVSVRPTRIRAGLERDIRHIRALIETDGVERLVVGMPRHMDGAPSRQTRKTAAFLDRLEHALPIPVIEWDERLTSFAAEQALEAMGLDWRKRRKHVDAMASTLILEDFLERGGHG